MNHGSTALSQCIRRRRRRAWRSSRENGRFEQVNAAFCDMTGYDDEQLIGLPVHELDAPRTRRRGGARDGAHGRRRARRPTGPRTATCAPTAARCGRRCRCRSSADAGAPFFIVQMTDISERRAAQEAAQTSHEMFRSLTVASPSGVFSCDHRGHLDYCNERMLTITGRSLRRAAQPRLVGDRRPARRGARVPRDAPRRRARSARWSSSSASARRAASSAGCGCARRRSRARDGATTTYVNTIDDITDEVAAQRALVDARGRVPDAGRELVGLPVAPRAGRHVSLRVAGLPGAERLRTRRARRPLIAATIAHADDRLAVAEVQARAIASRAPATVIYRGRPQGRDGALVRVDDHRGQRRRRARSSRSSSSRATSPTARRSSSSSRTPRCTTR